MIDYLGIVVTREEVESQDFSKIVPLLHSLLENPKKARLYKENVDLAFQGYDNTKSELFEIIEVRNFIYQLDEQFPYWLFFLTKYGAGLQCLYLCFMPPFLKEEAKTRIFPQKLDELLMNRWFPAMNRICEFVGMNEREIELLSERSVSYFIEGVFQIGRKK